MKQGKCYYFILLVSFLLVGAGALYRYQIGKKSQFPRQPAEGLPSDQRADVMGSSRISPRIVVSGGNNNYSAGGLVALASTDEPAVDIDTYGTQGTADIALYKANDEALLDYLTHDKEGKQTKKDPDISKLQFVTSMKHEVGRQGSEGTKLMLPIEEQGVWLLRITLNGTTENAFVLRSSIGSIVKEGDNEFIFWGQSFKTKRSITGGAVRLFSLLNEKKELASGSFDADGITRLPMSSEPDVAVVTLDADRAIVPVNLRYLNSGYDYRAFQPKSKQTEYFIFTDRPIYRPGDTVYYKTVLRDDDDARYTIPGGTTTAKIYKDWDEKQTLYEKTSAVTPEGTVYGDFQLPLNAETGYYTLKVAVPDQGQQSWAEYDGSWSSNTIGFQVEHFRKPEYSIDVTVPQAEYIAGDMMSFTVSGSYFSGQPLSGQTVRYQVYAADYYDYEYYSEQSTSPGDDYRYGYWGGRKVTEGEVVIGEKGESVVDLELSGQFTHPKTQVLSVEVEFDDGSGNPSFARKNVVVYPGQFGVYRNGVTGWGVKAGTPLSLPLILASRRSNVSTANTPMTVQVHRENWISYQEENKKYPSYKKEEEDLPDIRATTDAKGEATITFTPSKVGSYRFTVTSADAKNNTISKVFYAWVSSEDQPVYTEAGVSGLTVRGDKLRFAPGDVAKFTVSSVTPDRDIFFSLDRARVERFRIVRLTGKTATVDMPIEATDMPNVFAKVSAFSSGGLDQASYAVPVETESKKLIVNVMPDRQAYAPGDTMTLNIQTTDSKGNPVSADAAVWAVDKALFELVDERKESIFDLFWRERYDTTQESHSLAGITVYAAEKGGCFGAGTQVLMSGGKTKPIESVKVGESVLTRKSETDGTLVSSKVVGIHATRENGYLILNGNLRVTANHKLRVNNSWREAGEVQIGDSLAGSDGISVPVTSVEWRTGVTQVYNLEIENTHTYFAGGVWVHNEKGGGNSRSIFKDTAYWNPSLHTDEQGRAQVAFKLPDNLTTWVVAAIGNTRDTRAGQTTREAVVTKDVIVRPIVPNLVRVGDTLVLSALVQNFTSDAGLFDVSFTFDGADVKEATQSAISINAKTTRQLYWRVSPKEVNEKATLTVSARSQGGTKKSDTVSVVLPVLPFGFWERHARVGDSNATFPVRLSPDSDTRESSLTLFLSATLLGTLPSAMQYLVDYPYGCVEQTTSRFIPAVIAKLHKDLFAGYLTGKDVDNMIQTGIKRLTAMQHADGGWAWWFQGESDPYITAFVMEYLLLAKQAGADIADDMVYHARGYLEREVTPNAVRKPQTEGELRDDRIVRTFALSLLGSEKGKQRLSYFSGQSLTIDPDILALAVMANARNGDTNPETNGLSLLLRMAKTQGDGVYWDAGHKEHFGSSDASTALAIRAILAAGGDRTLAVKGARFLMRNRSSNYWSNTFATSQVVRAITELVKSGDEINPNYTYRVLLDGADFASGTVKSAKDFVKDIPIPAGRLRQGGSEIRITKEGDGQLYSTLLVREFRTDKKAAPVSSGLTIAREYANEKGDEYSLGVGDTVIVTLTVSGLTATEYYGVIEDELPSGIIPINERLKNEQFGQPQQWYYTSYGVTDKEVTRNGIVLSLYQVAAGSHEYTYKARVIAEGDFLAPPASVHLMYSPEISGRSGISSVTTTKKTETIPEKVLAKKISMATKGATPITIGLIVATGGVSLLIAGFLYKRRHAYMPVVRRFLASVLSFGRRKSSGKSDSHDIPPEAS